MSVAVHVQLAPLLVTAAGIGLIATPMLVDLPTRVIWNASASAPMGLYAVRNADTIHVGDLVALDPPAPIRRLAVARGYLAQDVALIKHVAALSGETVCRRNRLVTIDGIAMASALEHDRHGRSMPVWSGCRTLGYAQVFLLNHDAAASLDGRYFGPVPLATITGRLTPIWTVRRP